MAISHTRTVQRVEVYPAQEEGAKPRLMVVYEYTFDDSEDSELPVVTSKVVHLSATVSTTDEEGETTEIETDISSHDALVQTIATAVWAE
jgi:hypothetical protein